MAECKCTPRTMFSFFVCDRFQRLTPAGVSSEMEERLQEWLKVGLVFGGGVVALGEAFDSLDRIMSGGERQAFQSDWIFSSRSCGQSLLNWQDLRSVSSQVVLSSYIYICW